MEKEGEMINKIISEGFNYPFTRKRSKNIGVIKVRLLDPLIIRPKTH